MVARVRAALDASGQDRDWQLRGVEQPAFDAARQGRQPRCRRGTLDHAVRAADAASRCRSRPAAATATPIPLYTLPEMRSGAPLHARHAAAGLGAARRSAPTSTSSRSRASWTSSPRPPGRSGRVPPAPSRRPARARRRRARRPSASAGRASSAPAGRGRGFAFARYKNLAAYLRRRDRGRGRARTGRIRVVRAVAAVDSGEAVNPDGIRNQIEGGIMQSMSWTLYEAVTFDRTRITSRDWAELSDPALHRGAGRGRRARHRPPRPAVPRHRRGGAGPGRGAALANAVADATGAARPRPARRISATPRGWRRSIGPECDPRRVDSLVPNRQGHGEPAAPTTLTAVKATSPRDCRGC